MAAELVKRTVVSKEGPAEIGGQGPVRMRVIRTGPEENTIELSVSYEKAEVPQRAYYADFCDVVRSRGGVSLIFGKLKPGTSTLRNKVEVAFPEEMFIRQLWKNSQNVYAKLAAKLAQRLAPVTDLVDTDTVNTFRSNNVLVLATSSDEALLDFYYIAPTEIHWAFSKRKSEIVLDPVIRIVLAGPLLLELLEKCKSVCEQLPDFERIMGEEQ